MLFVVAETVENSNGSDTDLTSTEQNRKEEKGRGLNSYRNIIRGSSLFGGVQVFNILISLIRGKFVAIILGPEGMGISALFNTASNTIQRFSSLGLNQSIIREVSHDEDNPDYRPEVVKTSIGMTNLTALLGLLICVALCVPLSRLTFGDASYWWQFILLGAAVWFAIAGTGKLSILQGLHEVKRISKSSIVGSLTGLCIGVPLYYIFGYKGIVPAMVAIFMALYLFYSVALYKSIGKQQSNIFDDWKKYFPIAKKLLALGIILMSGELLATLVAYLVNLFIRMTGGVDDVGLYQAANSLTNQFSGVIFSGLAMDYFPRLSKVASDNLKMNNAVNRQSEVVAWLMTPAMVVLILAAPLIIRVLLAESFASIIPLMRWMGLGMLLRAFSFPMAYITFAKGNKKVFFILEGVCCNILTLVLSCLFYHWFGLIGLGYALVADNGACLLLYFIVNHRLYGYTFSRASFFNYLGGALLTGGCFIFSYFHSPSLSYSLMGTAAAIALGWGFFSLKSRYTAKSEEIG